MNAARGEEGFTLVELIVAVSVLTVVMGVLGQAVFLGLKTTGATADTLLGAGDAQALGARMLADVKGADRVGSTGGPPCEPATPAVPATTRVLWTQADVPAGGSSVAAYVVAHIPADAAAGTAARSELRRIPCTIDAATGASTPGQVQLLARWPGVGTDPQITCDGRPRSGGQTTLAGAMTDDPTDLTVTLDDATGFPASGPPYPIVVDGEAMTVTGGLGGGSLTVTRSSPAAHAAGKVVTWGPVVLQAPLGPAATDATLTVAAATGLPTSGPPYAIVVEGETMTVTGGFGTTDLTVTRAAPAPLEHPAGSAVTYASCGAGSAATPAAPAPPTEPARLAADLGAAATSLALNDATGFPTIGPDYEIAVGDERMTVIGRGSDATTLIVRRTSGTVHAAGTPVRWTPELVTLRVPTVATERDPDPLSITVSRRAT